MANKLTKKNKKRNHESQQTSEAPNHHIEDQISEDLVGKLLTSQERDVCSLISEGDSINSQRAQALIAIDDGATHAQAGQRAGLSQGQVKYWLLKFRKMRLDIFPEIYLKDTEAGMTITTAEAREKDDPSELSTGVVKKSKGAKTKKSKKKKSKGKTKKKPKKKGSKKQKKVNKKSK